MEMVRHRAEARAEAARMAGPQAAQAQAQARAQAEAARRAALTIHALPRSPTNQTRMPLPRAHRRQAETALARQMATHLRHERAGALFHRRRRQDTLRTDRRIHRVAEIGARQLAAVRAPRR